MIECAAATLLHSATNNLLIVNLASMGGAVLTKVRLFHLAFRFLPWIPHRLVQYGAIAAAYGLWRFSHTARARVRANLAHIPTLAANPDKLDTMVRRCFRALLLNYVDLFIPPTANDPSAAIHYPVRGLEALRAAQAQGKGVILVSLHSSGSEWGRYRVPELLQSRMVMPMEVLSPPELFDEIAAERSRSGIQVIPIADRSSLRAMLTALREGGAVIVALDRDVLHTGIVLPFFGALARIPTGPIALARLTGAPIVFVCSWRVALDRFTDYFIASPSVVDAETRGEAAMQQALMPLVRIMEAEIARYPDQWLAAFADDVWLDQTQVMPANAPDEMRTV